MHANRRATALATRSTNTKRRKTPDAIRAQFIAARTATALRKKCFPMKITKRRLAAGIQISFAPLRRPAHRRAHPLAMVWHGGTKQTCRKARNRRKVCYLEPNAYSKKQTHASKYEEEIGNCLAKWYPIRLRFFESLLKLASMV